MDLNWLATVEVKEWTQGKLHAKLLIIDESSVLTGSYNWTKSAEGDNVELMLEFTAPPPGLGVRRALRGAVGE